VGRRKGRKRGRRTIVQWALRADAIDQGASDRSVEGDMSKRERAPGTLLGGEHISGFPQKATKEGGPTCAVGEGHEYLYPGGSIFSSANISKGLSIVDGRRGSKI